MEYINYQTKGKNSNSSNNLYFLITFQCGKSEINRISYSITGLTMLKPQAMID